MTQNQQIKKHLKEHGKITNRTAARLYDIYRLSARIYELRHDDGMDIWNNHISYKKKDGTYTHYDEYIYNPGDTVTADY